MDNKLFPIEENIAFNFEATKSDDGPWANAEINGQKTAVLLDSGATYCTVNEATARKADPHSEVYDCDITALGVNGEVNITRKVMLNLRLGPRTYRVMCGVVPNLPINMIIGSRFMKRHNVVLDLPNSRYIIEGQPVGFVKPSESFNADTAFKIHMKNPYELELQTDFPQIENQIAD